MASPDFLSALGRLVGDRYVLVSDSDMDAFCSDWRRVFKGKASCVVMPRDTQEVAAVVRLCAELGVPLVPQGGNTGLSGGATPDPTGTQVVLSLKRMNAIRRVDLIGETMEVEAGCVLQTAQEAAADVDLLLPISFAAEGSACIGGVLSSNAGGVNVLRYGMARSRVLGLEVVTASGQVVNGLRQLRKDNAGYDWKQWFLGTEGTLGIVTAAVLQLTTRPKHRATAMLAVSSAEDALRVLQSVRQGIGETLSAFELMSGSALELVTRHQGLRVPLSASPWYVLLEASSSLASLCAETEGLLGLVLERHEATDGVVAESERQRAELWALRESVTEAEAREGRSVKHDVSVPIAAVPAFLRDADRAVLQAHPNARINAFGHVGDGNIHYNVIVSAETDADALNVQVHDVVGLHGGSISAEHGIGQYRVDELRRCRSAVEIDLMRCIKNALDPAALLNPGKVIGLPGAK